MLRSFVSICFFIFCYYTKVQASHIVGGEIYYTQLNSSGDYEITMKHYRDCYNGNPQALDGDLVSYIFIYNSDNGTLVQTIEVNALSNQNLSAPLINPCLIAPGNVCVNEAIFKVTVNLPLNSNGYDIVYQRCCRNATIVNIQNPGSVGSTIYAHIPGSTVVSNNSSPRYTNFPPIFICTNDPLHFDNSATDPDGDVIRYELCEAFLGATTNCPKPGSGYCTGDEPGPPPYPTVPYSTGYSGLNPINGSPAFQIDSITGLLTGTAIQTGQYVLTVCAKEYRNGQLISINRREFQFNVVNCGFPIAAFPAQVEKCSGMDFTFTQNSFNATQFYWEFGDSASANGGTVNHTYTDTGVYTVMLVATNNNPGCADTAYKQVYAYPKLAPDFITPLPLCLDGNSLNFTAAGIYDTLAATFEWNFGNGATPSVSFVKNPTSIVFNTDGIKTVLLTVSQFGCTKTISKTITIYPEPRPQIIPGTTQCSGDTVTVQITYGSNSTITNTQINQGIPIPNYQNLGGGLYQFVYPDTGIYNLSVIAQNNFGCIDTTTQPIKAYPSFTPYFIPPDKQCIKNNSFNFTVQGTYQNLATFTWIFNSNANINTYYGNSVNNVSFSSPGYQTVILTGKQYSCIASDTQQVYVVPEALASIKPQDKFCEGLSYQFTNLSQSANSWYWNFGVLNTTNDTSTLKNPTFQFPDTGTYLVTLVAINDNSCFDTTILPISIKPLVKPYFPPPGNQCLDDNNFNLQASGYNSNQALFGWDFPAQANYDTALTSTISGLTFNTVGAYPITLYINEYGCLKSYTDTAFVFEPPKARIELINISGCLPVTVSFKDSSYSTTQYSHWWDFGDGNTNTEANPTHTYNTPGTYTVSLIIKNHSGCTRADTFSLKNAISVYPLPKSGLVLDSTERSVFEPVIQFTDVSSNADHCILFFGDGQSSSNCNSTHWYPDSGWYQYTQIVTNKYGCSDTLIGKIYIRPEFIIYIPNAFTPNNDKLNAFFKPVIWGIKSYEFWVFDRWGLELFYTQDINTGWDGTYKGKEAPIDVYVYKVRYINVFNKSGELNGTFTLIR